MNVYLDSNATTKVAKECMDAMVACLEDYGNPSSMHVVGQAAKKSLMDARSQVAALFSAAPQEMIFTSSGTEGNHSAILGGCALNPQKRHIVTTAVEHPSTLSLLEHLEKQGYRVTRLEVDAEGRLDLEQYEKALTEDTALVSMMWANNETGVIFPIQDAARIAKSKGCLFHTDAVQAAGKMKIDLSQTPVDLLSFSGHKMHAPKGIGGLFVRKGLKLPPLFFGHQERGRRGGTENLPGIAALAAACRLAMDSDTDRITKLRDALEQGVLERIPFAKVNGSKATRVGNTSNMSFGDAEGEAILTDLDEAGVFASSGAACTAGGTEPSHVLLAMGAEAKSAVRFSLSRYTQDGEIAHLLGILPGIVEKRRT